MKEARLLQSGISKDRSGTPVWDFLGPEHRGIPITEANILKLNKDYLLYLDPGLTALLLAYIGKGGLWEGEGW